MIRPSKEEEGYRTGSDIPMVHPEKSICRIWRDVASSPRGMILTNSRSASCSAQSDYVGLDIEICPDALYMQLTGKTIEQMSLDVEVAGRDG